MRSDWTNGVFCCCAFLQELPILVHYLECKVEFVDSDRGLPCAYFSGMSFDGICKLDCFFSLCFTPKRILNTSAQVASECRQWMVSWICVQHFRYSR